MKMGNKYPQFCRDCINEDRTNQEECCRTCISVALEPTNYIRDIKLGDKVK